MPEEENPPDPAVPSRSFPWRRLLWLLVLVPPAITWFLIEEYRFKLPQSDDMGFVEFYQDTVDKGLDWNKATAYHNEHRVVFNRLCYAAMFHWFDGDVRSIAIVTFVIALVIAMGVLWLGRPVIARYPRGGWIIAFLAMAALFTAAQGYAWQWGFIYANHLPWLSVVLGMVLLGFRRIPAWLSFFVAGLVAAAATLSFGMGLVAWVLVPVFAFLTGRFSSKRAAAFLLVPWFIVAVACSAYALSGMGERMSSGEDPGAEVRGLKMVLQDPVHAAWFCFALLGNQFGQGTEFEFATLAPLAGALIFLVIVMSWIVVLIRRDDEEFRIACAPWLTLGLGVILSVGLIAVGRLSRSGILAEAPHYIITTCYGAVAAVFLLPLLATKMARLAPLLPVAASLFLALQVANWKYGIHRMKFWHTDNLQLIAAVRFIDVLEPGRLPNLHQYGDVTGILQRMRKDGQLDWIDFVPHDDASLDHLRVRHPLKPQWAALTRHSPDGLVEGYAYVKGGTRPADAVVFSWRPDGAPESERKIFDVTFPRPPHDYFRRSWLRKENRAHYGRFEHALATDKLPRERLLIEAHVMNLETRNVRPMEGGFVLDLSPSPPDS